jgi:predicted permease
VGAIRGFLHRLRVLANPDGYAREVEREIRFHLELERMQKAATGLDDAAAEIGARKQFGNVTHVREEVRRMTGMEWMDRMRQNLGYAWRGLRQSSGFTVAVVVTLGLGLGVNAAMFTFLDRVFVQPPAGIASPAEVRRLYSVYPRADEPNGRLIVPHLMYTEVREIRNALDSSTALGLFDSGRDSVSVKVGANLHPARRTIASASYFRVLGVRPAIGRLFDRDEDRIEVAAPVAVISHAMWQRVFGGDPGVIGSTMKIKYRDITIIGVTPEDFSGIDLDRSDFWMPIGNAGSGQIGPYPWYDTFQGKFAVIARFPDAPAEQRFLQVASLAARRGHAQFWKDSTAEVRSGPVVEAAGPGLRSKETSISLRLGGVALIVLLIAIANVSNLMLVRATRRAREFAIRRALGVTRRRLCEQLLTESVLLALIAGAVSLVLALWMGSALRRLLLPTVSWTTGVLDLRAAIFGALAALIAGLVIGLVPAFQAWRPDVSSALRAGSRNSSYRRSRLGSALLVTQAALSVVLLVGSGLFVRSLRNVQSIDLGFDVAQTITIRASADTGTIGPELSAAMPAILDQLAAIEGVESVAASDYGPMQGTRYSNLYLPGHDSLPAVYGHRSAAMQGVTPGYFRTVGQRLIAGRDFQSGDGLAIVVGDAMAKAYWPGESAVGKCLQFTSRSGPCVPVVGVVEDVHSMSILNDRQVAHYYVHDRSYTTPAAIVRASPAAHARVARLAPEVVRKLVPRASVVIAYPSTRMLEPQLRPWKLGASLFTAMGVLALVLASIGVYSVIAYSVGQRASEMGIRIALGAQFADITRLVLGQGLRTVAIGITLGVAMSLAAGKLVASLLYGISARDPAIMAFAVLLLSVIGLAASAIPAWRAARVNPVTTLRVD